ncbi:MNS1 (YJR131W) [Zygosaccharomyces parabailii]|nr:MNS1 (YJR131W) [Zygosaccharomyces parabailii]
MKCLYVHHHSSLLHLFLVVAKVSGKFFTKDLLKKYNKCNCHESKHRLIALIIMFGKGIVSSSVVALLAILWFWRHNTVTTFEDPAAVREQIEEAFLKSWRDYSLHGFGFDVYKPSARTYHNMARSGDPLGWIIVDSLDTMFMMYNSSTTHRSELLKGILESQTWIDNQLTYDIDAEVNIFETTIRMIGGLLSAYYWSTLLTVGNPNIYLNKAVDLADRLSLAFSQTKSGIPYSSINLRTGQAIKNHVDGGASSTAEFTTLQLEFKYLSYVTGNKSYWQLAEQVYDPLYSVNPLLGPLDGLAPIYTDPDSGRFMGKNVRLGSRGDSFYEYLLKQYLLTHEKLYYDLYRASVEGVKRHLVALSQPNNLVYIGEKPWGLRGPLDSKMDHLVCFMGGLLAMGATEGLPISKARKADFWDATRESDWQLAQDLTYTCYQMYKQSPSGLAPEIVVFNDGAVIPQRSWVSPQGDFYVKPNDRHNLQRPETVESIMFLYHLTKEKKYRQWGYEIWRSFDKHARSFRGKAYTSLQDCMRVPTKPLDNMESFWLAETLKYLHLLFQDNVDLTKAVFNTEAHPFPVFNTTILRELDLKTGWAP